MSHVHAMLDAKVNGYETITIMEEDAMTKDLTAEDINVDGLLSMLNSTVSWNTVRLGYRPYFFEQQAMAGGREGSHLDAQRRARANNCLKTPAS